MAGEYQRAADFIETADEAQSLGELGAAFARTLADFGVPHFTVAAMVSPDQVRPRSFEPLIRGVTEAWAQHYWEQSYFNADAAVHLALQSEQAFFWADIEDARLSKTSARVFEEVRAAMPIRGGYVIPAHDRHGFAGIVALMLEDEVLHAKSAQALKLVSLYTLERAKMLYSDTLGPLSLAPPCPLSARQREILAYAAMGKSEGDTGDILGLASTTVRDHLKKIRELMGVRTKTQAVALAVRNGWIRL